MKYAWLLIFPWLLSAQTANFALSTANLVVSAGGGSASVQLVASPPTAAWTASSNASWLHLSPADSSGTGSALVAFTYDPNPNPTEQSGTLNIAGLTLTVTQAGSSFVPVSSLVPLISQGLNLPYAVALDGSGNLYIADTGHNAVEEWVAATQQLTTLVSTGLNAPHGVAVDSQGNVYIADAYNNAIKQWSPVSQQVATLVSAGLNFPLGVAVDGQGNVYIADFGNNAVEEWNATTMQLTTLVGSGLNHPTGVAVDAFGNVYIADFRNNRVEQWNALSGQLTTLISQGLSFPNALTVDGQGNVYLVDGNNNALKEWSAATQAVSTLVSSGVNGSFGLATDGQGHFYVANTGTSSILQLSSAYVGLGATGVTENPQAGNDSVAVQELGANVPLTATSDQSWLTITGTAGGVISFAFTANTSAASRVAHILVLGQQFTVTQSGDLPAGLSKSAGDGQSTPAGQPFPVLLEVNLTDGSGVPIQGAGVTFSVTAGASGAGGTFSSTPAMPILTDQNGNAVAPPLTANGIAGSFTVVASVSSLNVTFSLANLGYALGSNSVVVGSAAGNGTVLVLTNGPWTASSNASWLQIAASSASGVGSALIQFTYSANINAAAQVGTLNIAGLTFTVTQAGASFVPVTAVTTLISSGLKNPQGVAVDTLGNLYIADTGNNAIKEWSIGTQQVTALSSAQANPKGVAVDVHGNVYIADTGNNAIEEYTPSNQQLNQLITGLAGPTGVAVDGQGNVYFSNTGSNAIVEWNPLNQQSTTLANTGLLNPTGVAVDGEGNVYFADSGNNAIKVWTAANGQVNPLPLTGLNNPTGVAVDGLDNVDLADTGDNAIKQWNAGNQQLAVLVSAGVSSPAGVAVDALGNIYVADTKNNAIEKLTPAWLALSATSLNESYSAGTGSVTAQVLPAGTPLSAASNQTWLTITGISGGVVSFSFQANTTGASRSAQITILGVPVAVTQSGDLPASLTACAGAGQSTQVGQPFATLLAVCVTDGSGNAVPGVSVTFSVTPGASGASGTFSATPPMPVATNANGVATAPALTANSTAGTFNVVASAGALNATFTLTNLANTAYSLESSSLLVSNAAGSGSVLLLAGGAWTASSNAPWLQIAAGSASGTGNALIQFTYTANTNASPQTGTLNISGLTFTVTQAGASYTLDGLIKVLVSGLSGPQAVAVDGQGDVYFADTGNNEIKEWNAKTQQVSILVSSGLNYPTGVAVDSHGNVYIADRKNNAIKEWSVTTGTVTALVSTGLSTPIGVAVDSQGNVYYTDAGHNEIKEYVVSTKLQSLLVSTGIDYPEGIAVDAEGNVYFADTKNNAIKEWIASTKQVTSLVTTGLNTPYGVAVDGDGNVYIADSANNAVKEWSAASHQVATLVSTGLKSPSGVAVDGQGDVYISDTTNNVIKEYTAVYVSVGATTQTEQPTAGTNSISVAVLPASTPVTATSSASWLTITSTGSGAIAFSFTANTTVNSRAAQITVLGQQMITITQNADVPATIAKTGGTGQSAVEGKAFASALQIRITDAAGNGVQGVLVTFKVTPGAKGASGTFSATPAMPIATGASGYASSPIITANSVAGTFTVTASAGSLSISFTLTVTP